MNDASGSMLRFSAEAIPEAARLDMLRESVWRKFHGLDLEQRGEAPVQSRLRVLQLPQVQLHCGSMSAARLWRADLETGSQEQLLLASYAHGFHAMSARRQEATAIGSGEAALFSSADYNTGVTPGSRYRTVRVSRAAIAPLLRHPDDRVFRRLPRSPALALLCHYVDSLMRHRELLESPAVALAAAHHVRDLMALAIGASAEAEHEVLGRSRGAARLLTAKRFIADNLTRGDLSVRALASHLGVTPRYVQQLFERDGTTYSRHVLEQRLLLAHRLLSASDTARRSSITAVALDAGFGDLSYFNRCFRRRFGCTPSELIADPRGAQPVADRESTAGAPATDSGPLIAN